MNEYLHILGQPALMFDTDPDGGGGGGAPQPEKTSTFTQAQLDVLFAERAKSARSAGQAEVLEAVGVKSVDELKQIVESGKAAASAKAELEGKLQQSEAEKADIAAKTTRRLQDLEIRAEAERQGFLPEAIADVLAAVDRSKITEKDDTFEGIGEAVKAVAGAKKHWLKISRSNGTPRPGDPKPPQNNSSEPPKRPAFRL